MHKRYLVSKPPQHLAWHHSGITKCLSSISFVAQHQLHLHSWHKQRNTWFLTWINTDIVDDQRYIVFCFKTKQFAEFMHKNALTKCIDCCLFNTCFTFGTATIQKRLQTGLEPTDGSSKPSGSESNPVPTPSQKKPGKTDWEDS